MVKNIKTKAEARQYAIDCQHKQANKSPSYGELAEYASQFRTLGKKFDLVGAIISYEAGELRGQEVLELFSHLIKTGQAWSLQGAYGRMAENLIDRGYLSDKGKILNEL